MSGFVNTKGLAQPGPKRRMYLEALAHADSQRAVTRCAECRWKYEGSVESGKRLFEFHMHEKHKREVKRKR